VDRHARRLGELAHLWDAAAGTKYAYVLALYLGDGYIARYPRTFRLEITLDAAYPGIIGECKRARRGANATQPSTRLELPRSQFR